VPVQSHPDFPELNNRKGQIKWRYFLSYLKAVADYPGLFTGSLAFCDTRFLFGRRFIRLVPQEKILRYLGPDSSKYVAYPMAVAGGLCLAVCSCTILPLFAGIRKSGAGLGPAIVFLYTAPATNILAIIYTSSLIGWDVALARIILSILFAILIGLPCLQFSRKKLL
jgi:uncharacterized membrane protein YraQ (UPF0718 family)